MAHPNTKDWSEICVHADQCVGTTRRAVLKLEETLTEEVDKLVEMGKNFTVTVFYKWTSLFFCPYTLYSPQQVAQC